MEEDDFYKPPPFGWVWVTDECKGTGKLEAPGGAEYMVNGHSWTRLVKTCKQEPCLTHGGENHAATHTKVLSSNCRANPTPSDRFWDAMSSGKLCYSCRLASKAHQGRPSEGAVTLPRLITLIRAGNAPDDEKNTLIKRAEENAFEWAKVELEKIGEVPDEDGW